MMLGLTTLPSTGAQQVCSASAAAVQTGTDPSYQYAVPAGGGQINSWSTYTANATAGTPVTLLVLRPSGPGQYTVVGFDAKSVPSPVPANATFSIASPIAVTGGELLGLYNSATTTSGCDFYGGSIPQADTAFAALGASAPTVGATYSPTLGGAGALLNVAANLVQNEDAGVTGSATPASIAAGGVSEYEFTVTNAGPSSAPITFADTVPAGLAIMSAVAGSGRCTITGQAVSCTISNLAAGSSAPVSIVVKAPSSGQFADPATVFAPSDPNAANNSATATLAVITAAGAARCVTVRLAGVPLPVAKTVIRALNCKVGKVTTKSSKQVAKGLVISTSPRPGARLAAGTGVKIVVSSGRPKKHKRNHH
jgi:uncharacterized repeat protein (TIGR01451 family)